MFILSKIFGDANERFLKKLQPIIEKINRLEREIEKLTDSQLKAKTQEFKERLKKQETLDDLLVEAFVCVREAAKRTIGQRHFDAQLIGGIVLHQGKIAEMKTGEGKTLAATLAVYLNALEGKGVHLVTVNDYLAKRDTNWMGPIYYLLGLSVGCIVHEKAYLYQPEKLADKNKVTVEMENLREVPRPQAYEADITYGTNNEFGFDYLRDNMVADLGEMVQRPARRSLGQGRGHYFAIVDEVDSILIDEARTPLIISAPDVESTRLYETFAKIVPKLKENIDYNIDQKMKVATLTDEGITKVEKILGMNIYTQGGIKYVHHLETALRAQTLFKPDRDYVVKDGQVIIVDDFTGRLMFGRRYSEGLHQAIEAREGVRVQEESRTLATITFQNYFRMYKKLAGMTGTALTSAEEFYKVYGLEVVVIPTNKPMIRDNLPDKIYRTEKGKFQAVIEEIKKRHQKGQPVLVGTVSIEKNELLSALLKKEGIPHQVLNAKHHEKEAQIIAQAGEPGAVTVATNMAGRGVDIILGGRPDEGTQPATSGNRENSQPEFSAPASSLFSADQVGRAMPARRSMVPEAASPRPLSDWQEKHDEVVRLDGLHVIGTERHEARRIDNQLRGRAGRQGDPGSSQFFVSLEDDLMRIFGSERIKKMMEVLHLPEDQSIENKMVSKAIESAQAKIEGFNFDIRKHVLEYDDVMNKQREVIYSKRKEVLETQGLKTKIQNYIESEIKKIVEFHTQENYHDKWNLEEITEVVNNIFPLSNEARNFIRSLKDREEIIKYLINLAKVAYGEKEEQIGSENIKQIEKLVILRTIDLLWTEHLDNMEHLRDSVRLRAYGQRDPLVEYKNEGHRLFQRLLQNIQSNVVGMICKVAVTPARNYAEKYAEQRGKIGLPTEVGRTKVGRNQPCPCGSGKKFKKCHGR